MAVSYVGAGTYVSGNNAAVTPGLPSGIVDGDLLVIIAAYREDTATSIPTPAGWTAGPGGISSATAVEMRLQMFYRTFTTGVTAPSVTFTGGGANDTTQAIMLAFRGARVSGTVVDRQLLSTGTLPSNILVYTATGPFAVGDMAIVVRAATNDDTPNVAGTISYTTGGAATVTQINNLTTQGADASLNITLGGLNVESVAADLSINPSYLGSGADGLTDIFVIHQVRQAIVSGSGGAISAGTATATYRKTKLTTSGSGGAVVSGSATVTTRSPTFRYSGSGGAVGSGTATATYRKTILLASGTGGAVAAGSAATLFVSPKNFYIDPFLGSDTNTGLSWAQAFRTFHPIAERVVTLAAGDRVLIAKTPDPIDQGVTLTRDFTALPKGGFSFGWSSPVDFSFPDPFFASLKCIEGFLNTTGWVTVAGSSLSFTSLYPGGSNVFGINVTSPYVQDRLLAYKPLPATLNLSAFPRLEVRVAFVANTGLNVPPIGIALSLCSDAAGAVELLRIPLTLSQCGATVFGYNGTLPNGINSISLRSVVEGGGVTTSYAIYSLIACLAHTNAAYLGHHTQYRVGSHEGATWIIPYGYSESAGVTRVRLALNVVGPGALSGTALPVFTRTVAAWDRYLSPLPLSATPRLASNTIRDLLPSGAQTYKTTFNLVDLTYPANTTIKIIGGYDPNTNVVTGVTALSHRQFESSETSSVYIPPFLMALTTGVDFSNIDVVASHIGLFAIQQANSALSFDNCGLYSVMWAGTGPGSPPSTIAASPVQYVYYTTPTPTLTQTKFKNCRGLFYLYSIPDDVDRYSNAAKFADHTLENCILAPWCGYPGAGGGTAFYTAAKIVGSLKVYCLANTTALANLSVDSFKFQLPTIESGSAGTYMVYGGGACYISPADEGSGVISASYTYPKFVLENTCLMFTSNRIIGLRGGRPGGDVTYVEVPEYTITTTSNNWNNGLVVGTPGDYRFSALVGNYTPDSPILRIRKLTHTGSYNTNTGSRSCAVGVSLGAPFQISDVTLSDAAPNFDHRLIDSGQSLIADFGPEGERLFIMDGVTTVPKAYTVDTWLVGAGAGAGYGQGHYDIRNAVMSSTSASFEVIAAVGTLASGTVRFLGCTISNPSIAAYNTSPASDENELRGAALPVGFDRAIIHENSSITTLTTLTTAMTTSANTEFVAPGAVAMGVPLVVAKDSPESYGVYYPASFSVEKDFTILNGGTFSWRTRHQRRLTHPLSFNLPLGTFPVRQGSLVTISLQTRKTNAQTRCGLVVHHNGCGGYLTAPELVEYVALNTAAVDTWQAVSVQFTAQRTGDIDVAFCQFGVEGAYAWHTDLRIIES